MLQRVGEADEPPEERVVAGVGSRAAVPLQQLVEPVLVGAGDVRSLRARKAQAAQARGRNQDQERALSWLFLLQFSQAALDEVGARQARQILRRRFSSCRHRLATPATGGPSARSRRARSPGSG